MNICPLTCNYGTLGPCLIWCVQGENLTLYDLQTEFQCLQCAEGCDECTDSSPCIVSLNIVLRSILLVLQCVIIGCLPVVVLFTYKYSHLKVIKAASPVLLRIIILGAFFIYSTVSGWKIFFPEAAIRKGPFNSTLLLSGLFHPLKQPLMDCALPLVDKGLDSRDHFTH